jgi:hypothetical protein
VAATLLFGIAFVAAMIAVAWTSYFTLRALAAHRLDRESQDLASAVVVRIAALHALILALVFNQEMRDYQALERYIVQEATAIADIYEDIARYGSPAAADVQAALMRYARLVVTEEWPRLGRAGHLVEAAWLERDAVYEVILDLEPATAREQALRTHMLAKVQRIGDLRLERQSAALHDLHPMFWVAAVAGVVLVSLAFFGFAPTPLNLGLIALFGAFTGLVMLFVYAFSNPFTVPGEVAPAAFERLLEERARAGMFD